MKLKDVCRTRWVERIDAYATFLELLPPLHASLQAMVHPTLHCDLGTDWSWDGETITRANGFLFQLQSSTFLVAFCMLVQVYQVLKELTVKLRSIAIDVVQAYAMVESVVSILKDMRRESEFHKQFIEGASLGKKLHGDDFELSKPCIAGRQAYRDNTPSNVEDYYRITLYDEFLSHVVAEMEARFVNNPAHKLAIGLLYLLPTKSVSLSHDIVVPSELKEAIQFFSSDLPNTVVFDRVQ